MADVFKGARFAGASAVFQIPFIRQCAGMISAFKADAQLISEALSNGDSVAVTPGGIGEMYCIADDHEEVLLRGHKGFVRQALRHGVPIVPVYIFGNSQTWRLLAASRFLERISRYLRVSLVVPCGRWGSIMPRKVPLVYAIGDALECSRIDSPTDAQVDELHSKFIEAVQALYEMFQGSYGWASRPLYVR